MKTFIGLLSLVALVGLNATAANSARMMRSMHSTHSMRSQGSMTLPMRAQNGSGESGSATLTPLGNQTRVVIGLSGENTTGSQPAHIHFGSCSHLNPIPRYGLKNVILGHSNTVIDAPMSKLTGGHMAVNVHESANNLKRYVSCGNIR
jgi:hypothetical protein